jgi:hypothetical protein
VDEEHPRVWPGFVLGTPPNMVHDKDQKKTAPNVDDRTDAHTVYDAEAKILTIVHSDGACNARNAPRSSESTCSQQNARLSDLMLIADPTLLGVSNCLLDGLVCVKRPPPRWQSALQMTNPTPGSTRRWCR